MSGCIASETTALKGKYSRKGNIVEPNLLEKIDSAAMTCRQTCQEPMASNSMFVPAPPVTHQTPHSRLAWMSTAGAVAR